MWCPTSSILLLQVWVWLKSQFYWRKWEKVTATPHFKVDNITYATYYMSCILMLIHLPVFIFGSTNWREVIQVTQGEDGRGGNTSRNDPPRLLTAATAFLLTTGPTICLWWRGEIYLTNIHIKIHFNKIFIYQISWIKIIQFLACLKIKFYNFVGMKCCFQNIVMVTPAPSSGP